MNSFTRSLICLSLLTFSATVGAQSGDPPETPTRPTLAELKIRGARQSRYRKAVLPETVEAVPTANLVEFQEHVGPILKRACVDCHGPDTQEGNIRIDTLDPNLLQGDDVNWWLEVMAVLGKGEMPPADAEPLPDDDRAQIVDWLAAEIQVASAVRRAAEGHSSFRRMTRYEYNYALQDLLGLPFNFAKDLPPDPVSEDGFENSSELLHMSATQFATYREAGRRALLRATVRGERPPARYWGASLAEAARGEWAKQESQLNALKKQHQDDPAELERAVAAQLAKFQSRPRGTHYKNLTNGRSAKVSWNYRGAKMAWKPVSVRPQVPPRSEHIVILPPRQRLIVELGDQVPDRGTLRVRVRAARTSVDDDRHPSLQLEFGWQASNDSQATVRISDRDAVVQAPPNGPQFYQWEVPLSEIYPRNSVRNISQMGDLPSPSEYIKLVNSSLSAGAVQIDYVEVTAPVYEQWPPASHRRVFGERSPATDELGEARRVLADFMTRAWRRPATASEVDQKMALLANLQPACDDVEEAMVEVLATVLASPKFLYLTRSDAAARHKVGAETAGDDERLKDFELATRLSMFLWCSIPDDELRTLAGAGRLGDPEILTGQVQRMLADPRSRRFSRHFVRGWLGMQLLDYLKVDRRRYPQFDPLLLEAMREEPVAFFDDILRRDQPVLDFLHADDALVNERLARHYNLPNVYGNHFRRVPLVPQDRRGGLLTQAGLLAMNSDGSDSHPLKRGIWMLERLLNDPPPPPPPAVPEIDLADPEIARMTLKERIADHRNQAACRSCHAKIDPWGIAFENYDAVGGWRTDVAGKPVDASSRLYNGQTLAGMDGLKRFLLENRQDQFARALVHKLATYALGRPLTFADRSDIDQITAELRRRGDGLGTLVVLVATSDLFLSR